MKIRNYVYGIALIIPLLMQGSNFSPDDKKSYQKLYEKIKAIPDSLYDTVKEEDLLLDEVYIKLARDGWSGQEIQKIMGDYLRKNSSKVKGSNPYGLYAKQWLPTVGYTPGGDTLYQYVDTTYNERMMLQVRATVGEELDNYYKSEPYSPIDRLNGIRQSGIFRPVMHKPSSGRIHWIHVHPENDDSLMVIPDGCGIFKTNDLGKTWDCITDRIPVKEHRNTATHSAIPVDPDDWNHIFAFMSNGNPVYETTNGGQSWRRIEGATHKAFKRGYCFRDARGKLKFIGAVQNGKEYWNSTLWISEDTCKTWTEVIIPDELKDNRPDGSAKGAWFQQVEFDPSNRDMIYLPTSRSLFYFDDGATSYEENGAKKYRLKKMNLQVFDQEGTTLRSDTTIFPFVANSQGFLNINPNNPNEMWFACGYRNPLNTALYYTSNKGLSWITLQETTAGIGSGKVFGNESPWGWLGGFGVNYADTDWVYGCSMSSAMSSNGGKDFKEYSWGNRLKAEYEDGQYYSVSNSRHNADNHCIVSHKSGRVFRGSDGGLMVKDKSINNHQWTNIGGEMGQMLYYCIKVNEFGDQVMFGNTQDIDAQTYRYGRWGTYRGYEGSTGFINPYSNACYYPSGGGGIEGANFSSWDKGFTQADVCSGSWFLRRESNSNSFFRLDDVGRSMTDIAAIVGEKVIDFGLTRDKGHSTLFVLTQSKKIYQSIDLGNHFEYLFTTTANVLATDPNNSDILYLGKRGQVLIHNLIDHTEEVLNDGLPQVDCNDLIFHEGSGDLYFAHTGSGVYLKEHDKSQWRLWTKGYNPAKFTHIELNYTTQELLIQDYGRGAYVADLANPSDRYFKDGFNLKQFSFKEGRNTLGIDTYWTIPLYYNYQWLVNNKDVNCPYQYLTDSLMPGDKLQLKLTLRESPDVSTLSSVYTITASEEVSIDITPGKAISSGQNGCVDLGYVDYFFRDFTLDFWVKPESDGVLLANRQADNRDAKGWYITVEKGNLYFRYAPANIFNQPLYEKTYDKSSELNAGSLKTNEWSHVAVTHSQNGEISIYVNGVKRVSKERILKEHTLNNSMNLFLFADGYDSNPIAASLDELKIWDRSLDLADIRHVMYAPKTLNSDLIYYQNFNDSIFSNNQEEFSCVSPRIRKRGAVKMGNMPIPVGAKIAITQTLTDSVGYQKDSVCYAKIMSSQLSNGKNLSLYVYDSKEWMNSTSNIDKKYYNVCELGYQFKMFDTNISTSESVQIIFPIKNLEAYKEYKLFATDINSDSRLWQPCAALTYNDKEQALIATDVSLNDINNKMLIIVSYNSAIEGSIKGISNTGIYSIYNGNQKEIPFCARLVGELQEPYEGYQIHSNKEIVQPQEALYFTQGNAETYLSLKPELLGPFGEEEEVSITGSDDRMIPYPLRLKNRILPKDCGNSLMLNNGGLTIGQTSDFSQIHLSNHLTIMGWVRIDAESVLQGVKPLLFFRGGSPSVAMGIHLSNGNVRCHWNEESWSWNQSTVHTLTKDDLGKWVHLALVVRANGMDYYLNGQKYSINRTMNPTRISSPFLLGQNSNGDTWFKGAFDQVGIWNRSLTQDEVVRFMHTVPFLNDEDLVSYINMDYMDEKGNLLEAKSELTTTTYGQGVTNYHSSIPFNSVACLHGSSSDSLWCRLINDPSNRSYYVNRFEGTPYNYVQEYTTSRRPLKKEYYTLIFEQPVKTDDSLLIQFQSLDILDTDSLTLAIRSLGSEMAFENFIPAISVTKGMAQFPIKTSQVKQGAELMLFLEPTSGERVARGYLTLKDESLTNNQIYLKQQDYTITIQVKVSDIVPDDKVFLDVKESNYAYFENDTVILDHGMKEVILQIDKEKLDPFSWNAVTINLLGATSDPLHISVALEPIVSLKLVNGIDENHYSAKTPISTLVLKSELLQGVLNEPIRISTTTDVPHILNTNIGTLLSNRTVTIDKIDYEVAAQDSKEAGWNFLGNPYLSNINMTKRQNVAFESDEVTRFVYQYNTTKGVFETSDMTNYDQNQAINPFQPYFIQSMNVGAKIDILPAAKEFQMNRKVLDHYTASERIAFRMELFKEDVPQDRTDLVFQSDAQPNFVLNEDAPKLWSLGHHANELFTFIAGDTLSVNTTDIQKGQIKLGLKVSEAGQYAFKRAHLSGLLQAELVLKDMQTGALWNPTLNDEYRFEISSFQNLNERFVFLINRVSTNIQEIHDYSVFVQGKQCIINDLLGNETIQIFNISGQKLVHETCQGNHFETTLETGIYMVKITSNGREFVTKISIR